MYFKHLSYSIRTFFLPQGRRDSNCNWMYFKKPGNKFEIPWFFSLVFTLSESHNCVAQAAQGTHMYHKTMYFVYGSFRCPIKALRKFCCNNLPGKSHAPFSKQQACMAQIKVELINFFSHVHVLFRDHYRNERIVMTRHRVVRLV